MKRLLISAAALAALSFAGAAQAGHPHGHPHDGGYRYDRYDYCRPTVAVRYYAPPVVYARPVYYAPRPVCEPAVVYDSYYRPSSNVAVYGRNFGVQFNW